MILGQIQEFEDKAVGSGATLAEISNIESTLSVKLPNSYREFLTTFGWARFAHQELYGIGAGVPTHLDLVRNTVAERKVMEPHIGPALIPIMNDGAGNHFCLDTAMMSSGECPVVFWDHEAGQYQIPAQVANSFEFWLGNLLSDLS